jgi:hypothetical protein
MTIKYGLALAVAAATASGVHAAVLTFDEATIPAGYPIAQFTEQGYTITGNYGHLGSFGVPSTLHLDDGGTGNAGRVAISGPGPFDVASVVVKPAGTELILAFDLPDGSTGYESVAYDEVGIKGFRGGAEVASATFSAFDSMLITLDSTFRNLDLLSIFVIYPNIAAIESQITKPHTSLFCADSPCGHFDLDEVTVNAVGVTPVPLPPTLALLALPLVLLRRLRGR